MFKLALTGVMGPLLAGILTWKGVKFSIAYMGSISGGKHIAQGINAAFGKK